MLKKHVTKLFYTRLVNKRFSIIYFEVHILLEKLGIKNYTRNPILIHALTKYKTWKSEIKKHRTPIITDTTQKYECPNQIVFTDIVDVMDIDRYADNFIRFAWKTNNNIISENSLVKALKGLANAKTTYKSIATGNLYSHTIKSSNLDLLDSIQYDYIKGEQIHILIRYTITVSEKFKNLHAYYKSLKNIEFPNIQFNSILKIITKGKLFSTIKYELKWSENYVESLILDLQNQFIKNIYKELHSELSKPLSKTPLPTIILFSLNETALQNKSEEMARDFMLHNSFITDRKIMFKYDNHTFYKSNIDTFNIYIPESILKENFIEEEIRHWLNAIAPNWYLIKFTTALSKKITVHRFEINKYYHSKKDSLFLKNFIKINRKLIKDDYLFKQVSKDFSTDKSDFLYRISDFPMAKQFSKIGESDKTFVQEFLDYENYLISDLTESLDNLTLMLNQVSENSILFSNMRLQKLLFYLAIIGIALAIYGANAEYFNKFFKMLPL